VAISASCAVGLGKVACRVKVVKSDQRSLSFTVVPTISAPKPFAYISRLGVDCTLERLDILNIEREGGLPRNGLRSMFDNHGSVVETAGVASEGTAMLSETALQ